MVGKLETTMRVRAVLGMLVVAVGVAGCRSGAPAPGQEPQQASVADSHAAPAVASGAFDFYLLNLSWSPEFCATHNAPECASHPGFVVHGLWPQNFDGTYPEHCAGNHAAWNADGDAYRDIYPDVHLMIHEVQTHGSCTGLSPEAYLSVVRQAKKAVAIPKELADATSELQLAPAEILGDFAAANPGIPQQSFALSCGNNRLTAVEVCFGKDLKAVACQRMRTCHANVVKVTPVGE
jgi:ribonuclease T2